MVRFGKIKLILKEMRVWQWTKNALVFLPIIFSSKLFDVKLLTNTSLAFVAMCFAASSVYIINDLSDYNEDRKHPTKKNRPIASGKINKKEARAVLLITLASALLIPLSVSAYISLLIGIYIFINLAYSKTLKHKALADILIVAFFYIYRVYIGGFSIGIAPSGWLILTTFFLALFMITGKRRAELVTSKNPENYSRKVLNYYNEKFLDAALIMSLTLFIVFYSLYSILIHGGLFIVTILAVIYISLRYLYLIFAKNEGEEPEKIVFKDKEILLAGTILVSSILILIYLKSGI